jgi:hypothetical protein
VRPAVPRDLQRRFETSLQRCPVAVPVSTAFAIRFHASGRPRSPIQERAIAPKGRQRSAHSDYSHALVFSLMPAGSVPVRHVPRSHPAARRDGSIWLATLDQPAYLRAWTMLDAGSTGIQHQDRTARTYEGRRSHHRHWPSPSGCPQRSHCGDGSRITRDQQRLHTTPVSECERSVSHDTHARGNSRSSAPATAPRHPAAARAVPVASLPCRVGVRTIAEMTALPARAALGDHLRPDSPAAGPLSPTVCPHACTPGP